MNTIKPSQTRQCTCGAQFEPTARNQRYCQPCRDTRAQAVEAMRVKTRICRNPECRVEFVPTVQGQCYCSACRHARAEATGKVCQCGGIGDVIGGKCWPCRRAEGERATAQRNSAPAESTHEVVNRSLLGRFAQMSREVQVAYIIEMFRLMGYGSDATVEEVSPEMVDAPNQADIDSAFYDMLGGVL